MANYTPTYNTFTAAGVYIVITNDTTTLIDSLPQLCVLLSSFILQAMYFWFLLAIGSS